MKKPNAARASLRLFAALLLFCYSLVCIALPFQHNHGLAPEFENIPTRGIGLVGAPAAPLHTHIASAPAAHLRDHCLACEWQSAQVSAALPVLRLKFVLPPAPRIPTTLPRYLSVSVISTPSRAPPTV